MSYKRIHNTEHQERGIILFCDHPDCSREYGEPNPNLDRVRRSAKTYGWHFDGEYDYCPNDKPK